MRSLLTSMVLLSIPLFGQAQNTLTGRVHDENDEPLSFATVALLNPTDSILKYFGITNDEGIYQMKNVKSGEYLLQYSFVGMETTYESVKITPEMGSDLGTRVMKALSLDEVTIIEEYIPISFRSDTAEFNASAFTTKSNAVVEDLLRKIPGIEVDESGNIKALGEDVTKVLVDGKEFFGNDPKVATKNLPAEAVEKVQVYDKRSEEAEFSGIDDGQRERTINLMLNEDHKKGYFGDVVGGVGTGEHFKAGGKLYRFSENLQSAILGRYNNINEFGYTGKNMQSFGQTVEGENTTLAGGLNLSYNLKGNNRYFLSYLASSKKTILEQKTTTENYLAEGSYYQVENLNRDERDTPHKINFGVRHNFNKNHNLIVDGDVDISSNNFNSRAETSTGITNSVINNLRNTTLSESNAFNTNAKAVYIAKLNEDITQFRTNISADYSRNGSLLNWRDTILFNTPENVNLFYQFRDENRDKLSLSVTPTLVQKIKQFWYLSAGVQVGNDKETLNRRQEILHQDGVLVDSLIPEFYTQNLSLKPTLSVRRNSNKSQVQFLLGTSWDQFNKVMDGNSVDNPTYFYFLPGFSYEYRYKKGRRINFRYSTAANMPTVSQLYPVVNTLNLLSLYKGNLDLTPEYSHNLSFSWWYFDQFSFTTLFARISAGTTKNKIGWSQTTNEDLVTLITPVNVDYQNSLYSYISFSTPIRPLGLEINLVSHENLSKGISFINEQENIQTNLIHSLKLRIENRKKEKWDAAIGSSVSVTDARFSIAQNSIYYSTSLFTDIRFTPSEKWSFETEANVINYNSKSFDQAVSIPLITAGISYYFLQGEKASLTLRGFDLLNKYVGFERISQTNYLMQREWNTLGRYVMLEFNLRIGK